MWKWIVGILVVLAAACGGAGFFLTSTAKGRELVKGMSGDQSKPRTVRLEPVARGDIVRTINAPGVVVPKIKVEVGAQVSSRIIALPFREGDDVKKGDVVCRLDADEVLADLESAKASLRGQEASLEGLKADLAEAAAELGRTRELYSTNDLSKSQLEQVEARHQRAVANLRSAEHGIDIARANIVRAEKNLTFTTIEAPMDGTIVKLNSEVGEQVLGTFNNIGTVILEIADLSTMIVQARIDETNVAPVQPGQKARVYLIAYPDRVFSGEVLRVRPQKQTWRDGTNFLEGEVRLLLDGERVREGLTANVDIEVESLIGVLKVPNQAVADRRVDELPRDLVDSSTIIDKGKPFARVVYTIRDGKSAAIPVSTGPSDLTHTVILAGLEEGDRVVTGPYKVLVDLKHDQLLAEEGAVPVEGETKDAASTTGQAGTS